LPQGGCAPFFSQNSWLAFAVVNCDGARAVKILLALVLLGLLWLGFELWRAPVVGNEDELRLRPRKRRRP
jgi:hypothetical protein